MIKGVERAHRGNSRTKPHKRTTDQLMFHIPFINNKIDNEIRRVLDRHNIEARIVHPKLTTLLQLAQPKMKPTKCNSKTCPIKYIDCTRTHVVYEITCELCRECYVGSTVRALHDRAREHIASTKNQTKASAMVFIVRMHTRTWSPAPNYASGLSAPRRKTSCGWESKRRWLFAPESLLSTGVVKRQESTFSPELVHLHWQTIRMLPSTTLTISDINQH